MYLRFSPFEGSRVAIVVFDEFIDRMAQLSNTGKVGSLQGWAAQDTKPNLNQVECWFSILSRSALQGSSFTSVRMLVQAIEAFIESWNQNAAPFEWTKHEVHQQDLKRSYADLCH